MARGRWKGRNRCGRATRMILSHMTNHTDPLTPAFRALADPTRRAVVARLAEGAASVSDLAGPFDLALPTFLQHLKVLEAGGLIETEKQGRTRICRLNPARVEEARDWLARQREKMEAQTDRLETFLDRGGDLNG